MALTRKLPESEGLLVLIGDTIKREKYLPQQKQLNVSGSPNKKGKHQQGFWVEEGERKQENVTNEDKNKQKKTHDSSICPDITRFNQKNANCD